MTAAWKPATSRYRYFSLELGSIPHEQAYASQHMAAAGDAGTVVFIDAFALGFR